jgi:hypothetical protein
VGENTEELPGGELLRGATVEARRTLRGWAVVPGALIAFIAGGYHVISSANATFTDFVEPTAFAFLVFVVVVFLWNLWLAPYRAMAIKIDRLASRAVPESSGLPVAPTHLHLDASVEVQGFFDEGDRTYVFYLRVTNTGTGEELIARLHSLGGLRFDAPTPPPWDLLWSGAGTAGDESRELTNGDSGLIRLAVVDLNDLGGFFLFTGSGGTQVGPRTLEKWAGTSGTITVRIARHRGDGFALIDVELAVHQRDEGGLRPTAEVADVRTPTG